MKPESFATRKAEGFAQSPEGFRIEGGADPQLGGVRNIVYIIGIASDGEDPPASAGEKILGVDWYDYVEADLGPPFVPPSGVISEHDLPSGTLAAQGLLGSYESAIITKTLAFALLGVPGFAELDSESAPWDFGPSDEYRVSNRAVGREGGVVGSDDAGAADLGYATFGKLSLSLSNITDGADHNPPNVSAPDWDYFYMAASAAGVLGAYRHSDGSRQSGFDPAVLPGDRGVEGLRVRLFTFAGADYYVAITGNSSYYHVPDTAAAWAFLEHDGLTIRSGDVGDRYAGTFFNPPCRVSRETVRTKMDGEGLIGGGTIASSTTQFVTEIVAPTLLVELAGSAGAIVVEELNVYEDRTTGTVFTFDAHTADESSWLEMNSGAQHVRVQVETISTDEVSDEDTISNATGGSTGSRDTYTSELEFRTEIDYSRPIATYIQIAADFNTPASWAPAAGDTVKVRGTDTTAPT